MRRAAPLPAPLLLVLVVLLRCSPGTAQQAVAPARISTNFNPPNLQAVGDDNPQTMLVSQRSVKQGEWIRIAVGSPHIGIIADGVRVVQHEQRLCEHCRIEYTDAEDPREDSDWTTLQIPIAGPALFLSLQQRRVRHVRLIAVKDSVNVRWHVKDIVVYASTAQRPSSTAPTPPPTHRPLPPPLPPPPPPPPPTPPPPPPPPLRSPQAPSQVVRTATVPGRGGDCLNNCSGHGTCDRTQRRCRCSMGFAGFDCGIVLTPELSQRIMESRSYSEPPSHNDLPAQILCEFRQLSERCVVCSGIYFAQELARGGKSLCGERRAPGECRVAGRGAHGIGDDQAPLSAGYGSVHWVHRLRAGRSLQVAWTRGSYVQATVHALEPRRT